MLSPEDIQQKVQEELVERINNELMCSRNSLCNGKAVTLRFAAERDQKWVGMQLAKFAVTHEVICATHKHTKPCYVKPDPDFNVFGRDANEKKVYCDHVTANCKCAKYLLHVSFPKPE